MRNKFDRQLSRLNTELITMGALCEEAITNAVKYLTDNDENGKDACLDADRQIDEKERDIETLYLKLILQQQSVAKCSCTVKKQVTENKSRPPAPHYSESKNKDPKDKHYGNSLSFPL